MYALNIMTGAFLWRYLTGGQISSSPAVANSRVFFGAKDAKVYALGVIIPQLQAAISATPSVLRPMVVSNITVTVRNSTGPISGANLTLSSLTFASAAWQAFSPPVMTSPGTYVCNFTAPAVISTSSDIIRVMAGAAGMVVWCGRGGGMRGAYRWGGWARGEGSRAGGGGGGGGGVCLCGLGVSVPGRLM